MNGSLASKGAPASRLKYDPCSRGQFVIASPCASRGFLPLRGQQIQSRCDYSLDFSRKSCIIAAAASPSGSVAPSTAASSGGGQGGGGGGGNSRRRLIMLRHADSDGYAPGVRDHDREITAKGKLEAAAIAKKLSEMGWKPDLVLASNSKRTKQTLDAMADVMPELSDVDTHLCGSLYTECLLEVVDDGRHHCVMCVGHNKGWEEAASSMSGSAVQLETASAALLQVVTSSWKAMLHVSQPEGPVNSMDDVDKTQVGRWSLVSVTTPE
eukprot:gene30021-17915_t